MVADLMARRRQRRKGRPVLRQSGVLPHHEKRDPQPSFRQKRQDPGHDHVQIGRKRLPSRIAMDLEIGPEIVEVQRQAGGGKGLRGHYFFGT
jgi:hypothetical protein